MILSQIRYTVNNCVFTESSYDVQGWTELNCDAGVDSNGVTNRTLECKISGVANAWYEKFTSYM